jgi:hypothetical protein
MEKIGNGHRIYLLRNDTQTNRNTQSVVGILKHDKWCLRRTFALRSVEDSVKCRQSFGNFCVETYDREKNVMTMCNCPFFILCNSC